MSITRPERRYHWPIYYPVNICFFKCRIAGMKIAGSRFDCQHANIATYIRIDRSAQLFRQDLAVNLNARNLSLGVNTGISSPRTVNVNTAAIDQRERARQLTLHSSKFVLNLPSVKLGALVLKKKFVVH